MNILDEIVQYKKEFVREKKREFPFSKLEREILFKRNCFSLKTNLKDETKTGIITEFKRRSPSKGIINDKADVGVVTAAYEKNGASAMSILTDKEFFGGSNQDLMKARKVELPILRKDFIVDEWQVVEAKAIGADAILLIAACLQPAQVKQFANLAKNLGMEVLLELHEEKELDHFSDEIDVVGINNRNLKTFEVDIRNSFRLAAKLPVGKLKIAESGISSVENILLFRQRGFDGFLIGELFMKAEDPGRAFGELANELKKLNV